MTVNVPKWWLAMFFVFVTVSAAESVIRALA